ncbi:MAG: transketolase family protein [Bacteroidales bacterium]|nr:transketolase family protein [Bacteroidales bacterium]
MQYLNKGSKPTRLGFREGLLEIAKSHLQIVGLGSDITSSVSMNLFANAFPERFISLGIAEQNAVGVAAGMALSGKIPFFSTYGVFAALRTTDQIRILLCYNNVHVIIGGAHAGISVGPDGATHQALEDIAIMRVLPNMTLLSPCDANQTHLAVRAAVEQAKGPVYIRFGREAVANFSSLETPFEIGKAQIMKEGNDLSIIATGHMVWEALQAAYELKNQGIEARVINIHTIKPIDKQAIITAAKETKAIITIEEHQQIGGLGSAVAEIVTQNQPIKMAIMGMPDSFGESGKPDELLMQYGMTSNHIIEKAHQLL